MNRFIRSLIKPALRSLFSILVMLYFEHKAVSDEIYGIIPLDSKGASGHYIHHADADHPLASTVCNIKVITLVLDSLPLQLNINQGSTETYTFDKEITGVLSRNLGVVELTVDGNQVTITGLNPGRTGLKITAEGKNYYLGFRVNQPDGTLPGMPDYLSVASVSEDTDPDLAFWKDVEPGLKNKAMDIRYIYINGGPFAGWTAWDPERPEKFATESLRHGLIPFFVFYNIPDSIENFSRDSAHVVDPVYMTAYFENLNLFLDKAQSVMQGELFGVILEPDFLGYIKQESHASSPDQFITCVAPDTIAVGAGNIQTLVERINHTIQQKKQQGYNVVFGWQMNLWATPFEGVNNLIRATDDLGHSLGRKAVRWSSEQTTLFGIDAGILSNTASFISIDKYGLDAMGHQDTLDPSKSTWFFNNDHWFNYLYFAQTIYETSGYPVVLWQLPIGHINATTTISAYTGAPFEPLNNTEKHYEDSTPDFFLGDTFVVENDLRLNYFSQNIYHDSTMAVHGDTITWGRHMNATRQSGVVTVMFGAGVGASTTGIGNPPADQYFWIQKVQGYYLDGPVPVDWNSFNDCYGSVTCPPNVSISFPAKSEYLWRSELAELEILLLAWSPAGAIQTLKISVDGSTTDINPSGYTHSYHWTPSDFGTHTIIAWASDGTNSGSDTCQFEYAKFNPDLCGYPLWNKDTVYSKPGITVSWNGNVYESKWWTKGDEPGTGIAWNSPWKYKGTCPQGLGFPEFQIDAKSHADVTIYPNPFYHSTCTIRFNHVANGTDWTIHLIDQTGRTLAKPILINDIQTGQTQTFDLPSLSQGVYFLELVSDCEVIVKKLIIQE